MERNMPQMTSSFDKEASEGNQGSLKKSSSLLSVTDISLMNTVSKETRSFDDSVQNITKSRKPGSITINAAAAQHRRDVSTSSEESEGAVWNEEKQKDDPVGDMITKLLNEGKVPQFGYVNNSLVESSSSSSSAAAAIVETSEGFKLYPLFSARNFRALRAFVLAVWNHKGQSSTGRGDGSIERETRTLRFLLESFAVIYIAMFSLNDIVLRSLSEFTLFTLLGSVASVLIDLEEVKYASLALVSSATPSFSVQLYKKCNTMTWEIIGFVEREFLWGQRFQGRAFLWSDERRLVKFRRRHRHLLATNHESRHNRKDRRKSRAERRRREKRDEPFSPSEIEQMDRELEAKYQLEAATQQLTMKPPTFIPHQINVNGDTSYRDVTTKSHLESLKYCHQMIFIENHGSTATNLVDIRATTNERRISTLSPKEAIEVVDQCPDIDIGADRKLLKTGDADGVSVNTSESYSVSYDEQSDYSTGEDDDDESIGSYASESTARSMPWMVVGAKIGHKLLNSRKLRRVIANPAVGQQLIPDKAKKLLDGINNDVMSPQNYEPSMAHSWEGPKTIESRDGLSPRQPELAMSGSMELPEIKRPVHGMWTSAGSAAKPNNSFGAVTIGVSSPLRTEVDQVPKLDCQKYPTPSRLQHNGLKAPPPSPAGTNPQRQGGDVLGYSTPPPPTMIKEVPPVSTQKELIISTELPTPQCSNTSRKLITIDDSREPPPIITRLAPIDKGVKIVIPMFPPNSRSNSSSITSGSCFFQMGTVVSSRRIHIAPSGKKPKRRKTNCLSIKVILDKALLRGSKFVEANLRIMDEWNYVPRHSKFPIGSCVATTFGVGILVGWRVEDDMHIIRSLWNRGGSGSGLAYLRRDCIHSTLEAAVGFDVQTTYGKGKVVAYVRGGKKNTSGKYFVHLDGRHKSQVMEFSRCQILSCEGAKFVPVTEHIRAAALYRLEVLHYKAKLRERMLYNPSRGGVRHKGMWRNFSEYVDLFANSFSKAIAEDPDFDSEVDKLVTHIISVLDGKKGNEADTVSTTDTDSLLESSSLVEEQPGVASDGTDSSFDVGWNMKDMLGCLFEAKADANSIKADEDILLQAQAFEEAHDSVEVLIRVFLRTISVAKASVPDRPKLHIALAMIHEGLLFVRQVLRVQKKHTSRSLIEAWFRALNEISHTFGPLKQRLAALGKQITKKFKKHGSIAKRRLLRFVDIVLGDTQLLQSLELGDWRKAMSRIEKAIVMANITDQATVDQLHKGAVMMYKNLAPTKKDRKSKAAAARNGQKAVNFAKILKVVASPGRSFMRLLTNDEVLSLFDRVLLRVFDKDPVCSTVINIYASNFNSIRHLRTLNNMSVAGKLWETVLDAIDEELSFATSEIPEQTKYFVEPIVKLFSLGVSQFHFTQSGGSTSDWLNFLMEDEAVEIIQELDYKLIDSLESLCNDIKQVVEVLPYINTIDDDILNLMDEFDFDIFIKEISDVIVDPVQTMHYITERSTILVERFLDYLPRMSIPIERRELQDGWVLTCRSKDGGDLRLSDLSVLRENLLVSILGGENVFHTSSGKEFIGSPRKKLPVTFDTELTDDEDEDDSVLDEIRDMILSSQDHGSWTVGMGGLKGPYYFKGVPQQLSGLPMSDNLKTSIDLWQSSAISDFELLETAIREVSHQIQLQKEREENDIELPEQSKPGKRKFNPRVDPTVLFLDIKNLTLLLEDFGFRVEKGEPLTIFDPIFEGSGSISVMNVSIVVRVEVKKERVLRNGLETPRPVLQLAQFEVELEKLKLEFKETGADWILNGILNGFSNQITEIVKDNLKDQIVKQVHTLLEQVNGFIDTNPELLMHVLGITMADLEESIVCV